MTAKLFFSLILFLTLSWPASSQRSYRIKEFNKREFLIPPFSSLKFKREAPRKRFKYFYMQIWHISSDYSKSIEAIREAEIWQGKTDYFIEGKKKISKTIASTVLAKASGHAGGCDCPVIEEAYFKTAILNEEGSRFFIQIDYDALVEDITSFDKLHYLLMRSMVVNETAPVCGCTSAITWPFSISGAIAKELFERMPLPQPSALARYGYQNGDDRYSFSFIHPDIILKIDQTEKIVSAPSKIRHEWKGYSYVTFYRDDQGNIRQNRFARESSSLPDNMIVAFNTYKLASFADIQQSGQLRSKPYIAVYHPQLRRNNNSPSSPDAYNDDTSPTVGNSVFVHLSQGDFQSLDPSANITLSDFTVSIYNERSSIDLLGEIYLNNQISLMALGSTPNDVTALPEKFKLKRKFRDTYCKIKGNKDHIILLPNDHLIYKP